MKINKLKKDLRKLADPKRAKVSACFFKTKKGEYGYGDKFLGITVPAQRRIAKNYSSLGLNDVQNLLNGQIHEHRLVGLLILVERFKKAGPAAKNKIYDFYLKNSAKVNNWDLVDLSAPNIAGSYLMAKPKLELYRLAKSKNLWQRRIAIVATYAFIKNNDFQPALKISAILLNDDHDLIHKAVGWMLREVGKRDQKAEEDFLKKYHQKMPRTMLRYAIEKFSKAKRKFYL